MLDDNSSKIVINCLQDEIKRLELKNRKLYDEIDIYREKINRLQLKIEILEDFCKDLQKINKTLKLKK